MASSSSPALSLQNSTLDDTEQDENMTDTDGWFDVGRKVTTRRPQSWVFQEGHFKLQAKGKERRAVCQRIGHGGCRGKM